MDRLTEGVPAGSRRAGRRTPTRRAGGCWPSCSAWHRREDKSAWWRYYDLLRMTDEELIEEREPLAGLVPVGRAGSREAFAGSGRSRSRPRTTGSTPASEVHDPVTRKGAGEVVSVDDARRPAGAQAGPARSRACRCRRRSSRTPSSGPRSSRTSLLRTGRGRGRARVREPPAARGPAGPPGGARRCCSRGRPGDGGGVPLVADGRDAARGRAPARARARGTGAAHPGTARLGQDLHGRPHDRRAWRGGPAGRRRREQPQGHRQPARRRWTRSPGSASRTARSRGPVRIGQKPKAEHEPTWPGATPARGQPGRGHGAARAARSTSSGRRRGPGAARRWPSRSPSSTSCSWTRRAR